MYIKSDGTDFGRLLFVAVKLLNVYSVHHFVAFDDRWFVELLTATEFFDYTGFFKFTFEFFEGFFDVFAFFYRYYDHFLIKFYWLIIGILTTIEKSHITACETDCKGSCFFLNRNDIFYIFHPER